jgi:hypothetical protein
MSKNTVLAMLLVTTASAVAHAQDGSEGMGGSPPPPPPTSAGDRKGGDIGVGAAVVQTSGLSVYGDPAPVIDLLYYLDKGSAIDIIAGINFRRHQVTNPMPPPPTTDTTQFGFALGVGYRLYKSKASTHVYLEPKVALAFPDANSNLGAVFRAALDFGVEQSLGSSFSIGGAIGPAFVFGNSFKDIQIASSASLFAIYYF